MEGSRGYRPIKSPFWNTNWGYVSLVIQLIPKNSIFTFSNTINSFDNLILINFAFHLDSQYDFLLLIRNQLTQYRQSRFPLATHHSVDFLLEVVREKKQKQNLLRKPLVTKNAIFNLTLHVVTIWSRLFFFKTVKNKQIAPRVSYPLKNSSKLPPNPVPFIWLGNYAKQFESITILVFREKSHI